MPMLINLKSSVRKVSNVKGIAKSLFEGLASWVLLPGLEKTE